MERLDQRWQRLRAATATLTLSIVSKADAAQYLVLFPAEAVRFLPLRVH